MSAITLPPLAPLPAGLSERQISNPATELSYHIIEAGTKGHPLILLLHGFPEMAYSWRKVMPALSKNFYVVAVDQRGFGRTIGWDSSSYEEVDLRTFSMTTLVRDIVVLVYALGYSQVECLVGHDSGSVSASSCALARPDLFRSLVLMSHPFKGSPIVPFGVSSEGTREKEHISDIHQQLANMPEARKHYKWYYSTAEANREMSAPTGLQEFLRGYFHLKSADWAANDPKPLEGWTATELAKMPYYYIMPLESGMRATVASDMQKEDPEHVRRASVRWFPDAELDVYVKEWARTGFQGGLNWYRVGTDEKCVRESLMLAGKKLEPPCLFISGRKDWGTYQEPGVVENMSNVCKRFQGVKLVDGAGHWVQQEQPERVVEEILNFLGSFRS